MLERKELNKLVILTLSNIRVYPKAIQLYDQIKTENPGIMRKESVRGFRSFVKVLNSFEEVAVQGKEIKVYTLKR